MSLRSLTYVLLLMAIPAMPDNQPLLSELDNTIAIRSQYIQAREHKIALLKQQAHTEKDSTMLLKIYDDIYKAYYVFKFDSAMVYAEVGHQLARHQGNRRYTTLFQIHRSELLSIGGLYSEALDILNDIDSLHVEPNQLFRYYFQYFTLYSYKTSFSNDSKYAPQYREIAKQYLEKAIEHLSPDEPYYDYYMGEKYIYIDDDKLKAREYYERVLETHEADAREYAMTCFALAGNHKAYGEEDKYFEYMVKASMCDLKCAIMENSALQQIAIMQYEQGDIERADRYINVSMEDAKFYNNRLRMIDVSRILPQIVSSYQATIKGQNKRLTYGLFFISILVIALLLTAFFIHRQNRLLTSRRKELAANNEQLTDLNQQLSELNNQLHQVNEQLVDTNRKREGLASIYIDLCAKYIDKLGKYQTLVKRKIKANQAQELLQTISSTRISEEDAATFLNRFDKAFLELYPTFVDEFNALLSEDGRIQQKSPTALTTELRTFALIRLGVKNTADIAGLLFLSNQTIYNCRSVIKNRAINRETFDDDVQKLCTVIR